MGSLRIALCAGAAAVAATLAPAAAALAPAVAAAAAAPAAPAVHTTPTSQTSQTTQTPPTTQTQAAPTSPGAPAAHGGSVSVAPAEPAPGDDVALRVSGCAGRTGTAVSDAFVADARLAVADARLADTGGTLVGDSRIRSTAAPGGYDVTVTCDGSPTRVTGRFTVTAPRGARAAGAGAPAPGGTQAGGTVDDAAHDDGAPHDNATHDDAAHAAAVPDASPSAAVPASPVAPVAAGGGGTARLTAQDVRAAGPGTAQSLTGLLLAATAAVAVVLLPRVRARRGRGTD
ncbi:hypothetical protein GCM10010389_16570 [Streptomyces echinoruber]|uniref:Sortase n=1 Tax=Streptomyces echinoruber TaxID=68898 RepID=A0A918V7T2_9ACTN|nr:hypothetical protein GCM10010389_16570 [Streptomyces echinoruber]